MQNAYLRFTYQLFILFLLNIASLSAQIKQGFGTTNIACENPFFSQNYTLTEGNLSLTTLRQDKNNTFIATGRIIINPQYYVSFLMKLDALGKIIWAKRIAFDNTTYILNLKTTTDGGYIAVGLMDNAPLIAKFSAQGDLEWANSANVSGESHFRSVVQTKDGGYAASGNVDLNQSAYVAKFRADGTTEWVREIGSPTSEWSVGLEELNDGNLLVASNTTSTTNTYLMKLDINTGDFLWQKQYSSGAPNPCCDHSFDEITKTPDGNILVTGNWSPDIVLFKKIDTNGNVLWVKTILELGKALRGGQVFQTPDGGYIISAFDYNKQLERTILKLDSNFKIQWQKAIGIGGDPFIKGILAFANGDYWIGANILSGFSITKTDALAQSCEALPNGGVSVEDERTEVSDGDFTNNVGRSLFKISAQVTPLEILVSNRCPECKEICNNGIDDDGDGLIDNADTADCFCNKCFDNDSVSIVGVDTLCISTFTYKLKGYKCKDFKTRWQTIGNGISLIASTDTTYTVRFTQGTQFTLTAFIQDSCGLDTIFTKTHILSAPPILILPNDTLKICQGETVEAVAPPGYATYRWYPNTGVNDTSQRRITLTPSVSGKYFCIVSTAAGCVSMDSLWVEVKPFNSAIKTAMICEGYTYKLGDSTLSKSGTYDIRMKSTTGGCDTLVKLTLTVSSGFKQQINNTICAFKPLKIGDSTYTKAGNYVITKKGSVGTCDTIIEINLTTDASETCKCNVYIPNAFSPNETQGFNDTFYPFGSECTKEVVTMQIFDRWGELVFSKNNFPLNDAASGWDGRFKEKALAPAVFTYRMDILMTDGHIERFSGDVTIVK